MAAVLLILLLCFFVLNVPIAFAIGLSTVFTTLLSPDVKIDLLRLPQSMFSQLDSFTLLALPFFVLAGKLMEFGGISRKLIEFSEALIGHLRGGLAMVSILGCIFFAAVSGSAIATTLAIGSLLIPAMVAKGYDRNFSSALHAAGGTVGVLIPPSIPMVIYGVIASASIGQLFLAGIIPGVLVGLSLMLVSYLHARKNNYGISERKSFKEVAAAFRGAIWALLMPVIILGGIYSGLFTPTEASAVAVVYGFLVGVFIYKEITFPVMMQILRSTVLVTSSIGLIIGVSSFFGIYLTLSRLPQMIAETFSNASLSPFVTIVIINLFLLVLGTFMDAAAATIITVPILLPLVTFAGIDPVHFGIILIVNLGIGTLTPPLGVLLFVAAKVGETKYEALIKPAIPFILILIVDLIILTALPQLSSGFAAVFK